MKRIIKIFLFTCMVNLSVGQAIWTSQGYGPKNDYGNGIVMDNNGNSYVTGKFRDSIRFDNTVLKTSYGNFCAKFDSSGTCLWAIKDVGGNTIITDQNNYLYLFNEEDLKIQKVDFNGNVIWNKTAFTTSVFGSNGIMGGYASVNDLYITGYFSGDGYFGNDTIINKGNWDIFLARFDTSGQNIWAESAGSANLDKGYGIYVNNSNEVYVSGYFADTADFSGLQLISNGNKDIYIAKYNSNGNLAWAKSFGGTGLDLAAVIIPGDNNDLYLTGRFNSAITFNSISLFGPGDDAFLLKTDTAGSPIWAKNISGGGNDEEGSIDFSDGKLSFIATSAGNVTLDAITANGLGSLDICMGELDSAGNALWMKIFGGIANDEGSGIIYNDSYIYFTGSFNSTATFDGFQHTSAGQWDVIVGKIGQGTAIGIQDNGTAGVRQITVYPNPFSSCTTFDIPDEMKQSSLCLTIYNLSGNMVRQGNTSFEAGEFTFHRRNLPEGVYVYQLKNEKQILGSGKLVVQ